MKCELAFQIAAQSGGKLGLDDSFRFHCDDRHVCFLQCCTGSHVWLTSYDIVRLKGALAMTSGEFLERYTRMLYPPESGYPVVMMKMGEGGTGRCPFATEAGCLVYNDRPWVCRMFPLVPEFGNERPAAVVDEHEPRFQVHHWEHCLGNGQGQPVTIRQWRDRQGLAEYEEINREWKKVTHHTEFGSRNLLEGEAAELFCLGCYDIDRFRNALFAGEFQSEFNAGKELPEGIETSAAELLKLAFRWLRQVLFGEKMQAR